jgi:hypothetical protein
MGSISATEGDADDSLTSALQMPSSRAILIKGGSNLFASKVVRICRPPCTRSDEFQFAGVLGKADDWVWGSPLARQYDTKVYRWLKKPIAPLSLELGVIGPTVLTPRQKSMHSEIKFDATRPIRR